MLHPIVINVLAVQEECKHDLLQTCSLQLYIHECINSSRMQP